MCYLCNTRVCILFYKVYTAIALTWYSMVRLIAWVSVKHGSALNWYVGSRPERVLGLLGRFLFSHVQLVEGCRREPRGEGRDLTGLITTLLPNLSSCPTSGADWRWAPSHVVQALLYHSFY